ncbi:MAG: DUF4276 family protein [Candidatus Nealsonbacteria bacterium]|nr:DUF4276 family protein [Candidatus Nealsonbacteria bacterium]
MSAAEDNQWKFFHFGLIVTGKGEEQFLPNFFRSLVKTGRYHFEVIYRAGQRSPITSKKRSLKMVGDGKKIPDRDEKEIGLPARRYLTKDAAFVILVDDLEADRAPQATEVYHRYREALDTFLSESQRCRASVHFFVNMLEAYYFADAKAVNAVLGTNLEDYQDDVETIRHPKNDLKKHHPGFDEVEHGEAIVAGLDLPHVLARPETCAALRTLFGWCSKATGQTPTDQFELADGSYSELTKQQIDAL